MPRKTSKRHFDTMKKGDQKILSFVSKRPKVSENGDTSIPPGVTAAASTTSSSSRSSSIVAPPASTPESRVQSTLAPAFSYSSPSSRALPLMGNVAVTAPPVSTANPASKVTSASDLSHTSMQNDLLVNDNGAIAVRPPTALSTTPSFRVTIISDPPVTSAASRLPDIVSHSLPSLIPSSGDTPTSSRNSTIQAQLITSFWASVATSTLPLSLPLSSPASNHVGNPGVNGNDSSIIPSSQPSSSRFNNAAISLNENEHQGSESSHAQRPALTSSPVASTSSNIQSSSRRADNDVIVNGTRYPRNKIPPYFQVFLDINEIKERISDNRDEEVAALQKMHDIADSRVKAERWLWTSKGNGNLGYKLNYGCTYRSGSQQFEQEMKRNADREQNQQPKPEFTPEQMETIFKHDNLEVLYMINEQSERFSEDRDEEVEIIETFLRLTSSDLDHSRFRWKWTQKQRRWAYTYRLDATKAVIFQTMTEMIKTRLHWKKFPRQSNSKSEEYRKWKYAWKNEHRKYFTYTPFGVNTFDTQMIPKDAEDIKQYLDKHPDIHLSAYYGVCTLPCKILPDIRTGHFYDQNSPLYKFMEGGGKVLSGAVREFKTRDKAADHETYLQFAGFSNQDSGGRFTMLNDRYGRLIHTSKVLEAIDCGERNAVLTFGDITAEEDAYQLPFPADCNDLTNKFKIKTRTSPISTTPLSTNKDFSVYVSVALRKKDVGDLPPQQLLEKLAGDISLRKKIYVGKSLTENLKHGIRIGHFFDDDSPLYQAAKEGLIIFTMKSISGLTEQEAFNLESYLIFFVKGLADSSSNVDMLNREYGMPIHTEMVKHACQLGVGLAPLIYISNNAVTPENMYDLPIPCSSIVNITSDFPCNKQ